MMEELTVEHEDDWETYIDCVYAVGYIRSTNGKMQIECAFPTAEHAVIVAEYFSEHWKPLKCEVLTIPIFNDVEVFLNREEKARNR
jgi:hypothetical protein